MCVPHRYRSLHFPHSVRGKEVLDDRLCEAETQTIYRWMERDQIKAGLWTPPPLPLQINIGLICAHGTIYLKHPTFYSFSLPSQFNTVTLQVKSFFLYEIMILILISVKDLTRHWAYEMCVLMAIGFWSARSEEAGGDTDADVRSFWVVVSRQRPSRKEFFRFFPPTPSL